MVKSIGTILISPLPESMLEYQLYTVCDDHQLTPTFTVVKGGIDHVSLRKNHPFHGSRPIKKAFHVSRKIGDFQSYNLQLTAILASVMLLLEFRHLGWVR